MKNNELQLRKQIILTREIMAAKKESEKLSYWETVESIWYAIDAFMVARGLQTYDEIPEELRPFILRQFYSSRYKLTQEHFARKIPYCSQPKVSRVINGKQSLTTSEFVTWLFALGTRRQSRRHHSV